MPSRLITLGSDRWSVSPAAERRPDTTAWHLVLSFRPLTPGGRSLWAPYPMESASKAALFAQAARIADDDLIALLTERLSQVVT